MSSRSQSRLQEIVGEGEEGEGLEGEETEEEEDEEEEFLGEVSSPLSGSDLDNALIDVTPFADIVQQYCPSLQYGRPQYNALFYFVKKPLELIHLMQRLPVLVEVCDEEGASRGVGRFSLGPIFWEAVAVGYRSSSLVMPTTAASSESVSVQSPTGHSLGSVNLTLRFTCFGDTQYVELDRVEDEGDDTERTQVVSAKEGRSRANYRRVQLSETEYRKALCARDANRRHALTSANENITRTYTPSYPETAFKPDAERLLTGT
ncbi:hypothetical protein AAG570_004268 [Ranatra chinensis]|uniref:Uncharacterized protein n=1 Tax=Ranatra chinensis TaxID=642074 RepID=A0ABD0Y3Y2_9HEMI